MFLTAIQHKLLRRFHVVSGGDDGLVSVWNRKSGNQVFTFYIVQYSTLPS